MASVNKVTLIGNLGRDPEIRYSASGVAFCTISLATTRSWKDKQSGEKREETEWHKVVFNDKLAEIVGEYAKKGRALYVEGRLRTRKWQDKEGKDQYTTEIIANEMQLLGGRDDGDSAPAPAPAARGNRAPAQSHRAQAPAPRAATGFDDLDDGPPFALNACDFSIATSKARALRRADF